MSKFPPSDSVPLCSDLDGTLCREDTLWVQLMEAFRSNPWTCLLSLLRLLRGRAQFKEHLARLVPLDPARLNYRREVCDFIQQARDSGRPTVLVTAASAANAHAVASHLGCFDEIASSDSSTNLKGRAKASLLVSRFGPQGYDYIGDGGADLPAWHSARHRFGAHPRCLPLFQAHGLSNASLLVHSSLSPVRALVMACRPHQWLKNMLLLVPLLTAHLWGYAPAWLNLGIAFAAFCCTASAVYLFNDLMDRSSDSSHPWKQLRPVASGTLPIPAALLASVGLAVLGLALAARSGPHLAALLGLYLGLNLAYTLWTKHSLLLDVFMLAAFYTLRIFAGAAAVSVEVSTWLLQFSSFFFLGLALLKRYADLRRSEIEGRSAESGRGYRLEDASMLSRFGAVCAGLATLILALYVHSPEVAALYHHPRWLWLVCPALFFWLMRCWLLASQGQVRQDPLLFAIQDRASYGCGLLILLVFWAARPLAAS